MDELGPEDREAVLLRFFQGRQFSEIGTALRLSEDAARKRVARALEKLRDQLGKHGIASTSAALVALFASGTLSAAPASLAASVTGAALATGGATAAATTLFTLTKLQLGLAAVVVASGAAGLITQQHSVTSLRATNATLQAELTRRSGEIAHLTEAGHTATAGKVQLEAEVAAMKATATLSSSTRPAPANTARAVAGSTALSATPPTTDSTKAHHAAINPARLAEYHREFDAFVRQRRLTTEQADTLFAILSEWDDVRKDFQAVIRAQGLVWTPATQKLRDALQQKIEVEPLIALLGPKGDRAYFDFESSIFYRALVDPLTRQLANKQLPLDDDQITQLAALAKANMRTIKPDPTSMGSETVVDWAPVVAAAGSFVSPAQLAVIQAEAEQHRKPK